MWVGPLFSLEHKWFSRYLFGISGCLHIVYGSQCMCWYVCGMPLAVFACSWACTTFPLEQETFPIWKFKTPPVLSYFISATVFHGAVLWWHNKCLSLLAVGCLGRSVFSICPRAVQPGAVMHSRGFPVRFFQQKCGVANTNLIFSGMWLSMWLEFVWTVNKFSCVSILPSYPAASLKVLV